MTKEKTKCQCGCGCDYERAVYEKVNDLPCNNAREEIILQACKIREDRLKKEGFTGCIT